MELLYTGFAIDGDLTSFNGENTNAYSHEAVFPSGDFPIQMTDKYSQSVNGNEKEFSRGNTLTFNPGAVIDLVLNTEAATYDEEISGGTALLVRDWDGLAVIQFRKIF